MKRYLDRIFILMLAKRFNGGFYWEFVKFVNDHFKNIFYVLKNDRFRSIISRMLYNRRVYNNGV